ncbi:hypothetical protein SCUCBS95973_007012 [Sporothrix curviconia]|uniref:Xylanolytic transcriptional activator regulatory domain-containing protein n=1 Tax=Sporothrix curviconia TaxID=1260050 RepID=A0ABP0CA92_9PEZI
MHAMQESRHSVRRPGANRVEAVRWKLAEETPAIAGGPRKPQPPPSPQKEQGHSRDEASPIATGPATTTGRGSTTTWNPSSTIDLVEEAFHYHDSTTPPTLETSAFSAHTTQPTRGQVQDEAQDQRQNQPQQPSQQYSWANRQHYRQHQQPRGLRPKAAPPRISFAAARDLLGLLPDREPARLLLNTYFDRVHWYLLLFHQDDFRRRFAQLYDAIARGDLVAQAEFFDFAATLLAAFAFTLQHAGAYRKSLLRHKLGLDPDVFQERVLVVLKSRLLDVLASGSLEAVQACVLLGSHYLYHGRPELAWPICGCGLRVAQALNLHRRQDTGDSSGSSGSSGPSLQSSSSNNAEGRKRVWWAVYEIETVCSVLYGYPLSISDSDCDTEILDPQHRPTACHEHSKYDDDDNDNHPLVLSMIIRAVLADIYGMYRSYNAAASSTAAAALPPNTHNRSAQPQNLLLKVAELDRRLSAWYDDVPPELRLDVASPPSAANSPSASMASPGYASLDEIDRDISASGPKFASYIYGLQRLSLNLAFENTRILLHRPLLSHEMGILPRQPSLASTATTADPFRPSIETCRAAALQTAAVGSSSSFAYANTTFAAAFFDMHLFTAGVTLCILTSLEPLSLRAHEAKMGVRSLMAMQAALQESCIMAAQGLGILKKLITLVLQKETEEMFEFGGPARGKGQATTGHDGQEGQEGQDYQQKQQQTDVLTPGPREQGHETETSIVLHSHHGDPHLHPQPQQQQQPPAQEACLHTNHNQQDAGAPGVPSALAFSPPSEHVDRVPTGVVAVAAPDLPPEIPEHMASTGYGPNIVFHENAVVARTLMDLEQVIYGFPQDPSLDQTPSMADADATMAPLATGNPFTEQDQGCIWGFDYFQMLDDGMHERA